MHQANSVGIFPVWYTNLCNEKDVEAAKAEFEFLKISDWQEMIDLLQLNVGQKNVNIIIDSKIDC